jgi:hypothetical protein
MSTHLGNKWSQIVEKSWSDESFKKKLLADPSAVLRENGIELPAQVQVRVIEDTDDVLYLNLPARPAEGELSEKELGGVSGGVFGLFGASIGETIKKASEALFEGRLQRYAREHNIKPVDARPK